jgi:hypothetical protein
MEERIKVAVVYYRFWKITLWFLETCVYNIMTGDLAWYCLHKQLKWYKPTDCTYCYNISFLSYLLCNWFKNFASRISVPPTFPIMTISL